MTSTELLLTKEERVAVLTLDRPHRRNALTPELSCALARLVRELDQDDEVDVLILTGADPAFCAGLDMTQPSTELQHPAGRHAFRAPTKPMIAAVNGAAVTGGLELALQCDFIIASERAIFADTHARVGVQPGWGMTGALSKLIGVNRARQMSLTGCFVDAFTAEKWGLANEVVPHANLLDHCLGLAAECASAEPRVIHRLLRTYREGSDAATRDAWHIEREAHRDWNEDTPIADSIRVNGESVIARGQSRVTRGS